MRLEFEKKFNNMIQFRFGDSFDEDDFTLLRKVINGEDKAIGNVFKDKLININLRKRELVEYFL